MKENRKRLVNEMKEKWQLDEDDIENDDCDDNAIVCGNADIKFIDIFNLCNQLNWQGVSFDDMEIYIDTKIERNCEYSKKMDCHLPSPDQFSICDGVIRLWYD